MQITLYQASIPVLLRGLNQLKHLASKGAAHVSEKALEESDFTNARLAEDMLPFANQIYIASDTAKGCAARLAGQEPPRYEDTEKSFEELIVRLDKTIAYLQSANEEHINGAEDREITLKLGPYSVDFTGLSYLSAFVIPNFYFHVTTAYNILRHKGVQLGKLDFIGPQ